ncbi:hypothetical protein ACFL09_03855 [Planctomycetota bacterium]
MNITIGNAVRGDDFFDREELLDEIWQTLATDSVLLAAPRRVGKTSVMLHLRDDPADGFRVIFLDGQGYSTAEDLVADLFVQAGRLCQDWRRLAARALGQALEQVQAMEIWEFGIELRKKLPGRWKEQGEQAIRDALGDEGKLLLIIDELPLLLHKMVRDDHERGKEKAQDLLDWLRYLRFQPDLGPRLRQLVGGSIGMARIAAYVEATHKINDLRQIEVGLLSAAKARELSASLLVSRGVAPDAALVAAMLDQVGTFRPIYIQIMASAIAAEVGQHDDMPAAELAEICYEQRAMGPEYRICFEDYYERLGRYYTPDEARVARRILRDLALAPGPVAKPKLLATYQAELGHKADPAKFDLLLTWLRDDFYVEQDNDGTTVEFKDKWLRDWWRRHHASGD